MKGLDKYPEEYFLKYKEKPVNIKPYNSSQTSVAMRYIKLLRHILKSTNATFMVRGSTLFKIQGKGDVEVGIYTRESEWETVLKKLEKRFSKPENLEENYARFNDVQDGTEVEIIVLKGHEASVDIKLHKYLLKHKNLLAEYENIKKEYSFSKREYQRQKSRFLSKVILAIPEDDKLDNSS